MKYTEIKSDYIKGRIAETAWDDRQHIDVLVDLLRFVTQEPTTAASVRLRGTLVERFPADWLALCREHSEELYREQRALREETIRARAKLADECEAEIASHKADWLKAGGRP